jgi:acid stress chaperone HdeB
LKSYATLGGGSIALRLLHLTSSYGTELTSGDFRSTEAIGGNWSGSVHRTIGAIDPKTIYQHCLKSIAKSCSSQQHNGPKESLFGRDCCVDVIDRGEQVMMTSKINILGLTLFCLITSSAHAQVTIDVSKITCEQFRGFAVTDPNNIALWLSGYYNGKRDNTIVNVQSFKDTLSKVKSYCITNPTVTVMQATEAVLGKSK